jgi:hypothetical protein
MSTLMGSFGAAARTKRCVEFAIARLGQHQSRQPHRRSDLLAAVLFFHPGGRPVVGFNVDVLIRHPDRIEVFACALRVLAPVCSIDRDRAHGSPLEKG